MKTTRSSSFATVLSALILIPLGMNLVSAVYVLPNLDKATAQQCKNHDWPKDKHQAHMAWCAANNYKTN